MKTQITLSLSVAVLVGTMLFSSFSQAQTNAPFDSTSLVRSPSGVTTGNASSNSQSAALPALQAQLADINDQELKIDADAKPISQQLQQVQAQIDAHNARVASYSSRCLGRQLPQGEYQSCLSEEQGLNAERDTMNSQKDNLTGQLQAMRQQWDGLEGRRAKINVQIDNLKKFAQENQDCSKLPSNEAAADCMKKLWDSNGH